MIRFILLFILTTNLAFAQQIKSINKGDTAPFTGYIIDKQFEKDRRQDRELLINERNKNKVWEELGKVREGREEFYKQQAVEAKREALKSDIQKVLYFVGGIFIGGYLVHLGAKVAK